ncbi:hypothetical protein DMA11_10915 [Marinilabiliaceae bacterium JC017]|nr:hypothetical protein DMA11_10915 [Marinilabiliaceae bacterium JC017]
MTKKAIVPGRGFGNIKFGMEEHEVTYLLGDPDEAEVQNYGDGDSANVLYYDEQGLSMSFDSAEDFKLVELSFESDDYTLLDAIHVGQSKEDFLAQLEKLSMEEYAQEDLTDEGFETQEVFTFEDQNISIWLEDDAVNSIQIGPFWVDDDTINWPE